MLYPEICVAIAHFQFRRSVVWGLACFCKAMARVGPGHPYGITIAGEAVPAQNPEERLKTAAPSLPGRLPLRIGGVYAYASLAELGTAVGRGAIR